MVKLNIVRPLTSYVRPKQKHWSIYVNRPDHNPRTPKKYQGRLKLMHLNNFLEDKSKGLERIAQDFYDNNYKAGRNFSYEVIDKECFWVLHYPKLNRTVTGVIRKGAATGRGFKQRG